LRFTHDATYGSVAGQVEAKLLAWYVAQEEEKDAKKAKPKVREVMVISPLKPVPTATVGDKELAFALMGISSEYPGTVCNLDSRRKTK